MARMMENAHDWEHLPFVHASSFTSIDLIEKGAWGWRAKIGLPGGEDYQLLDLIVDEARNYWVSTVYSGFGTGTEIHTQATELGANEVEVDVRFYLPEAPASDAIANTVLRYLADQYRLLYDEDTSLMIGRQTALDDWAKRVEKSLDPAAVLVGRLSELDRKMVYSVDTAKGRFCVRWWQEGWIAHSAVCPHMLGPLIEAVPDQRGAIVCPWHGYRFDIVSGASLDGKCRDLPQAPQLRFQEGNLYIVT
eukprot:CAMPEP_0184450516 /NCGR_PEP_ID=MMETSP0740-20130409/5798_1 /TAXON_ID=385413 /ORGANISM="Thalassiosira miniscula, Strain CCMP1093" /LENGTH=248 /DNA_ID=CAMNT_0026820809 /DNA_START=199 /DNA_END=945 /DNA_ORIENTATION=+